MNKKTTIKKKRKQQEILQGQETQVIVNGELNGWARIKYKDGAIYGGLFANSKLNGAGKKILPNGTIEEGTFKNGELNGQGKIKLRYGEEFGHFKNGQLHGPGKWAQFGEGIVEGSFIAGLLDGQGRRIGSTQEQSEDGDFIEDKQIQGCNSLRQRQIEEGIFRKGNMNGQSKLTLKNGLTFVEVFQDGKLYKMAMKGINKMIIKIIIPF